MSDVERFRPLSDPRPNAVAWPLVVWPPAADSVLENEFLRLEPSQVEDAAELFAALDDAAVWGSWVNPAAKLLLLEHAFEALGMSRVQLKTDVRNQRSQQAIARLGAQCEGLLRQYQRRSDGTIRDTVLFSILDTEWPSVRAGLTARLQG